MEILKAEDLWIERNIAGGTSTVLRGIDLEIPAGKVTVLLGETGAGKTILARALAGLLPDGFFIGHGRIVYRDRVLGAPRAWAGIRGREIFYAPQNAAACFNPVLTIGRQVRECCRLAESELMDLLARLQLGDPDRVLHSYPHALSGGENQRCLLALALAIDAKVLILDEPTSEIDAFAQDEFVGVLREFQRRRALTLLLVSHHLGLVRSVAQNLCIMRHGEVVASGEPQGVLGSPAHPYVREIAAAMPPA